jgi:hypothetical protein
VSSVEIVDSKQGLLDSFTRTYTDAYQLIFKRPRP